MPQDIPGFYFDAEKGKYFKILQHHKAPVGSKYTRDAIKSRKIADDRRKEVEYEEIWMKSWAPLKKNSALKTTINGFMMTRDLSSHSSIPKGKLWADSLEVTRSEQTNDRGHAMPAPSHLAWDSGAQRLISLTPSIWLQSHLSGAYLMTHYPWGTRHYIIQPSVGALSTMCVTTDSKVIVGGSEGLLVADKLPSEMSQNMKIKDSTSCRAHPRDPVRLLLGSSNHFTIVDFEHGFADRRQERVKKYYGPLLHGSEILDVSWLGNNVVLSGHRDGKIVLTDPRVTSTGNVNEGDRSVLRLQIDGSVQSLHGVTDNHLVASGIFGSLQLFDLRLSRTLPSHKTDLSQPLIQYSDGQHGSFHERPIAICMDWNIIAASNHGDIQIFDLWSGRMIESRLRPQYNKPLSDNKVTSLCFANVGEGSTTPTLYVGKSGVVEIWTSDKHPSDEDDF